MAEVVDYIIFPDLVSYGSITGPEYKTNIVEAGSGAEQRTSIWSKSRRKYIYKKEGISRADLLELRDFFIGRRGRGRGFLLKDWDDHNVVDEEVTRDGTTILLTITYDDGINPEVRRIFYPEPIGFVLKKDTVPLATPADYTLDEETGTITLSVGAAGTYTWSGEFYVPVRFDSDFLGGERVSFDGYDLEIDMVEVLLVDA